MRAKQTAIIFKADLARLIKSHIAVHEANGNAEAVAALRALLVAVGGGVRDDSKRDHNYSL